LSRALFDGKLELVKNNTYVTDISKCHAYKQKEIWTRCSKEFFDKEIKLINPSLIIFQGNSSYDCAKAVFDSNIKEEDLPPQFKNKNFPKIGKIFLSERKAISFLKIYHTSNANQAFRHTFESEDYKKLVKDRILPLIETPLSD
jgi:uracil-DNA glycosylase